MLLVIAALLLVVLVVTAIVRAVQIIPQATAAVVERLGRFKAVEEPGLVFLVPFVDKIRARIDLREQVRSFPPQPVITKDNLTVNIDTVVYYQVTNPKAAVYEIADYINGVEQTTTTTLRNVVGGLSLEETLTARDEINSQLRGELDKVTGGWGIRIARVEIKAIEPPASIQESMERQMKADREKRAMILTAEGQRESAIRSAEGNKQSQILTAEGAKQAAILNAEADRQSRILRAQGERAAQYLQAQGEAKAIEKVFAAIKSGRPTPELLAYQYLQTLPQMAQGDANKVWIVPSDFGKALEGFTKMLGAPGGDGVFRFEPSPVDDAPSVRPEDDDEAIKDWFDTSSDPEIARVVADAQAQARAEIPPSFTPSTPTPSAPAVQAAPRPGELPSRTPDELPTAAGDGRVGLPAGANRYASAERPPTPTDGSSGPTEWASPGDREYDAAEWSVFAADRSSGPADRSASPVDRSGPVDRSSGPADRSPSPAPWPRSGGSAGPSAPAQASWSDQPHDAPPAPRGGAPVPPHPAGAPDRESAVPTPPRGVRRADEDPDTVEHVNPARPGYPSPPRSPRS
jgi:regulator of protease activity HflC (stomatin/prohibitin superfamily)